MVAKRLAILEAKKTPEQKEKRGKTLERDDEERRMRNRESERGTRRMDITGGTVTEMEDDQVTSIKEPIQQDWKRERHQVRGLKPKPTREGRGEEW